MKLELQEHISRLLYDHECVVIPSFGAFLTRFHSAEINHATHMMRPPSKRVYFNQSINANDGLLAKSISLYERVTYSQALDFISEITAQWRELLENGKKLHLQGIGRLYLDDDSKLQFSPSLELNYLQSAYGLSIFRSPAIEREVAIKKSINKAIERHIVPENPKIKKRKVAVWVPWAAVLAPVIAAGIIGFSYMNVHQDFKPFQNLSSFFWSESTPHQVKTVENPPIEEIKVPAFGQENKGAEENFTPVTHEETRGNSFKKSLETSPVANETATAVHAGKFHVVVGSFKEEKNANSYITHLKAEGYDAYEAPGDQHFFRVSVGNFTDHSQAEKALADFKLNVNSNAWIYIN